MGEQWDRWDQYRFPELFARNLTPKAVSCNVGRLKWQLSPTKQVGYESFVPWRVALSDGFKRIWERGDIVVALDDDFTNTILELPLGYDEGSIFRPKLFRQETPQATTVIYHGLNRDGPVHVEIYSLDRLVQWDMFVVDIVDNNTCRVSFEDPTAFEATIF